MKFSKVILTSAIGFIILFMLAAVGILYLKNNVSSQLHPPKSELMQRAEKIADFSGILKSYNVTKALNLIGVTAVVAEHQQSGQYMAVIDPGWAMNISKTDIMTGKLNQKLSDYALKLSSPNLRLSKLEIIPNGRLQVFNQSVPCAKIKVKLSGVNTDTTYEGMIGIVSNPRTKKDELIVSLNKNGEFRQKIAENFFKDVKLQ